MALHFHRIPIVLGAESLRKVVNFYNERAKNVEYGGDNEGNEESCSTTALLQSSIQRIEEAKGELQKLYKEIRDEYIYCKDKSEKREILAEICQTEEESQLHVAIDEANSLIAMLSANVNESKNSRRNMEVSLGYSDHRAQKSDALTKDDIEIVQNPMAHLKKETAAKAYNGNRSSQKRPGEVMQSKQRHAKYRPNYGKGCIFCQKGNHLSTRCRTVSDKRMRQKALREQNRCWKCFSRDHNSFVCQKRDCALCGQKHHISLCLKKGQPQRNYGNNCRARDIVSCRTHSKGHQNRGLRSNKDQSDRRKPTSANLQMCMGTLTEPNLRIDSPVSEQLVLMTAEGSIWNARKQEYEKILFFFDSGAQKTAIDEELAEQFGLARQMTEKCAMSGIGGRIETFESHIVPLKIGTTFGGEIEITVQTRPVITEGFPSVRLERCDVAFLKANEIFLANTKLRGELQIPRVLVGLDYYHDLVTHTGVETPSGLHLAKTVFGHTVYGRGLSSVAQPNSVSYNLTAICERARNQAPQKNSDPDGPIKRQRSGNLPECSGEIFHAYGFTTSSLSLKEVATDVAMNHSVAMKRPRCPQLQQSAVNTSRRRPALHVKPPSTPSSHRSPSIPATRHRVQRPRAEVRPPHREVNPSQAMVKTKTRPSDRYCEYSCRPPQYHRRFDDPHTIHAYCSYRTSCGGGGTDPSSARDNIHSSE